MELYDQVAPSTQSGSAPADGIQLRAEEPTMRTEADEQPPGVNNLGRETLPPFWHRWATHLSGLVPPMVTAGVGIGLWYYVSYLVLDDRRRFMLPPPHQVIEVGILDVANRNEILEALNHTAQVALMGLAIAMVLGVAIAILMSQATSLERSIYPYAVALQTVPVLAIVPLIGFWFGFNFGSRVLICVMVALFPIILNTLFGLQSVDPNLRDLFRMRRAGRLTRLWKLELPGALPAMFAGFRIASGLAVIGAIVADFFFRQGSPGIGRMIDVYRARLQTEELLTGVILSSLLGIIIFVAFGGLGNRLVRNWDPRASRKL